MIQLLSTVIIGGSPDLYDLLVLVILVLVIVFLVRRI